VIEFIRTYYIFIYYKIAVANKERNKANKSKAFITMAGFINAMPLLVIFIYFVEENIFSFADMYEWLRIPIMDTHRGNITGGVLLIWSVSTVLTYLACCFKVDFKDIPKRLSRYEFFKDEAAWKAITPVCVQMIFIFGIMRYLLHKG
jgi:hypothetical protein